MDMEEIRYLLGSTIFARAKAYLDRVEDLDCETSENGVRHLTADVRGGGRNRYHTQAWLRENGSFVSASCTCPYNENGEGPCCKHIGALLMLDEEGKTQPAAAGACAEAPAEQYSGRGAGNRVCAGECCPEGQLCFQPGNAFWKEMAGR